MANFIRRQVNSKNVPDQLKEFVRPVAADISADSKAANFTVVFNGANGAYVLDPTCNEAKELFKTWYFESGSNEGDKVDATELVESHAKSCEQCQKYLTENKVFGTTDTNDFNRQVKKLCISEAMLKAEREIAIESADSVREQLETAHKSHIVETKILASKIRKVVSAARSNAKTIDEYKEEIKTTMTQLAVALEKCDALEIKISDHAKQLKEHKETAKKESVSNYVKWIVESRNLKLTESSLALLERCGSREEVDRVLNGIIDGMRESALHSRQTPLVEAVVEGIRADSDRIYDKISNSVSSIMSSM